MNGMIKTNIVLLSLALCAACSNDSDDQTPPLQPRPLTIEVTENPLIQDGEAGSRNTRAEITTTTSLTAFNLDYVYGAEPSTGSRSAEKDEVSGKWKEKGTEGWPSGAGNGDVVTWYAHTDGTFILNGGTPYISFTVDENAAYQKDLLVATASGTYSATSGKLSFTFDHACAALRFYVKKAKNLDGKTLSVSSIVLKNVVKQGNYFYGTGAWTLSDTRTNYTLLESATALASDTYTLLNGTEANSYLFLIPQTLTAWDPTTTLGNTYLEVTCSIDGGSSQTAYIPFGTTFAKGTSYDVKINIGKNSLYSGPNTKIIN